MKCFDKNYANSWIFVCQEMVFDKRILYVKESVGVLMVLKGFKNKSNKPYRSSLAHELRFTTYRVDIILFLCQSNRVNYACESYEFSFWTHKRQGTLINERFIDRKGELLNYLEDMVGSCATIRQEIKIKKVRSIWVWICRKLCFDKFTWIGTHTPLNSKCHKIPSFMKMTVRKFFHYERF